MQRLTCLQHLSNLHKLGNNIKKIVSFGDSYTFGHDLPDASTAKFSQLTYVALYANHLAVDYQCLAVGGSGTEGTCRRVFETINELNESTLVVIMWPDSYRREIHTEKGWTQIGLPNEFSSEFEKIYYREMLFDNKWMNYLGLKDMLVAQELLKNKNIPYVFLAVKDDLEQLIHTPIIRWLD